MKSEEKRTVKVPVRCGWCDKGLGTKEIVIYGDEEPGDTTGICKGCLKAQLAAI